MSYPADNSLYDIVLLPDAVNGVNSRAFSAPKGAKSAKITIPALVGTGATLKVQAMRPLLNDQETPSWTDVTVAVFGAADVTYPTLDGLLEGTTVTLPISALGGGVFRFVASEAQTGAIDAISVYVAWGLDK